MERLDDSPARTPPWFFVPVLTAAFEHGVKAVVLVFVALVSGISPWVLPAARSIDKPPLIAFVTDREAPGSLEIQLIGPDGKDRTVAADPFHWEPRKPLHAMKVGELGRASCRERV